MSDAQPMPPTVESVDGLGDPLPTHHLLDRIVKAGPFRTAGGLLPRTIHVIGFAVAVYRETGKHGRVMVVIQRQSTGDLHPVPADAVHLDAVLTTPDGYTGKAVWLGPVEIGHHLTGQHVDAGVYLDHRTPRDQGPRVVPLTGVVVAVHRGRGKAAAYVTIQRESSGEERTVGIRQVTVQDNPVHRRDTNTLVHNLRVAYGDQRRATALGSRDLYDRAVRSALAVLRELAVRGLGDLGGALSDEADHRNVQTNGGVLARTAVAELATIQRLIRTVLEEYGTQKRPAVDESAPLITARVFLSASEEHRGVPVRVLRNANRRGSGGYLCVVVECLETVRATRDTNGVYAGQLLVVEANRIQVDHPGDPVAAAS